MTLHNGGKPSKILICPSTPKYVYEYSFLINLISNLQNFGIPPVVPLLNKSSSTYIVYRVSSALIGLLKTLQAQMYQYYHCPCRIHYLAVFCFASAVIYLLSALRARYDPTPKNWQRIERPQ